MAKKGMRATRQKRRTGKSSKRNPTKKALLKSLRTRNKKGGKSKVYNPEGLAAYIGRRKIGKKTFYKRASASRKAAGKRRRGKK
jgi:hypothetical protein